MGRRKIYKYGLTEPLSFNQATEEDLVATEKLISVMKEKSLYESVENYKKRVQVLATLEQIINEWVQSEVVNFNIDTSDGKVYSGKIFTFGSYRLGIVSTTGDIDALCIVPYFITRIEFFKNLSKILEMREEVQNLIQVPDAYTPIMKFAFNNIEIDLLFASLAITNITVKTILDDSTLRYLDEKTARSMNGCRVNDMLLTLVPSKAAFITTARFIKYWAKCRGIYSNIFGYLGGVAWVLLVARVCQLYPRLAPNMLIRNFFNIYSMWKWPLPVQLTKIKEYQDIPGYMSFKSWDPDKNLSNRNHLMPIITPAFPSMNTTHNVMKSTMKIILSEFQLGLKIFNSNKTNLWNELIEPYNVFADYSKFFFLIITAQDKLIYGNWYGWVESKIRLFYKQIEAMDVCDIRPYPKTFKIDNSDWEFASVIVIGIKFKESILNCNVNFSGIITEFLTLLNNWQDKPKDIKKYNIRIKYVTLKEIKENINEYNYVSQYITE